MNRSTVRQWQQKFLEDRLSSKDKPRSGQPSTVTADNTNAEIIITLLNKNQRIMVREIEGETDIPKSSVLHILKQVLGKKKWRYGEYRISYPMSRKKSAWKSHMNSLIMKEKVRCFLIVLLLSTKPRFGILIQN